MALFPGSLAVEAQFGVVIVIEAGQVEVATFRNDGLYSDGRRPDHVSDSRDPREDVLRRDFTINGLLLDPETGAVMDFVEGRQDIDGRVVRTIGNAERRFEEDRLRMLRAARFAASFEYTIDPETHAAIHRLSAKITTVSAERVRDELLRILPAATPAGALNCSTKPDWLKVVLPEIVTMKGVEQPPQCHPEGDVWTHTMLMIGALLKDCSPTLAMAFCCTMLANLPRSALLQIAFGSITTFRLAREWRKRYAAVCASRRSIPRRSPRWSRTICGLATSMRCVKAP